MRSHTQERLVACPTCGSMFSSNTKLFDHLHRQAEPVGKDDSPGGIICFYASCDVLTLIRLHISFEQSRLYVSIVARLFPARGF